MITIVFNFIYLLIFSLFCSFVWFFIKFFISPRIRTHDYNPLGFVVKGSKKRNRRRYRNDIKELLRSE